MMALSLDFHTIFLYLVMMLMSPCWWKKPSCITCDGALRRTFEAEPTRVRDTRVSQHLHSFRSGACHMRKHQLESKELTWRQGCQSLYNWGAMYQWYLLPLLLLLPLCCFRHAKPTSTYISCTKSTTLQASSVMFGTLNVVTMVCALGSLSFYRR